MSIALPDRASVRGAMPWAVLGLGLALVVVNVAVFVKGRTSGVAPAPEAAEAGAEPPAEGPAPGGLPAAVTLAAGKLMVAGIAVEKARLVALPTELGVPGRIDVNQERQVDVRPRAPGVIRRVKVVLGQAVKAGEVLAVLDSAEVGTARLLLRAKQRELVTARVEAAWKDQVARNVASLIPELKKRTDASVIEKQYADRPLGTFRATLIPAYSKFDIAAHEEEKTEGLHKLHIVGEHPAFVAHHTREGAQAEFQGVLEQAGQDAKIQSRLADQQVKLAESNVVDAAKRLHILGVPENIEALIAHAEKAATARTAEEDLTAYELSAPFAGTILTKSPLAVASQRAEVGDVLFSLADLATVWVTANIPESDYARLPALRGGTIRLSATAYPGREFQARLLSVGATVDPGTRTVPILAETRNPDGLLKIGLFVRIVLDTTAEAETLTVPASAVVEIDGKAGVFCPGKDDRSFAFTPVKLGREAGDRRVVASGLSPGDAVVSAGAFLLKSELVLQNEADDD